MTWINAVWTRLQRPPLVKSDPCRCYDGSTILPLCWARMAPKVSEEEGSYATCFYGWFLESLSELSFTFHEFSWFNWHFFPQFPAWRFFLSLSLTWRQRSLIQKYFLSIPSLTLTLYITLVLLSQKKPLQWKEINAYRN